MTKALRKSESNEGRLPAPSPDDGLPPSPPAAIVTLAQRAMALVERQINPATHLAESFTGDTRLADWAVTYDNAVRAMVHLRTGRVELAKETIDYFIENTAIRKTGWVLKNGRRVPRSGWIINIVDASEARPGGRGVEHVAHTGPNAYLGLAAAHLYRATGEKKYLRFARERWQLIRELQNEDANDPNYGGIRMGPLGDLKSPREQRVEFGEHAPSFYDLYNAEHAADFMALSQLLAQLDGEHRGDYDQSVDLIATWDRKIWDDQKHLFYVGTTAVRYFDENIGRWIEPGVIPMYPLDANALKISVYGLDGLERFGGGTAEKLRQAIDDNFKVKVRIPRSDGTAVEPVGYDFVSNDDRKHLVMVEERGPFGDERIHAGSGRLPLLSDEWSTWVALADLRMAADYRARGDSARAAKHLAAWRQNALENATLTAVDAGNGVIGYPYAHPLPYSLNKPVGFGWNTHHKPYAVIASCARVLGFLRFDPFLLDGGAYSISVKLDVVPAPAAKPVRAKSLYTEAEMYLREAWEDVKAAQTHPDDEEAKWQAAIKVVERMMAEHPDWEDTAKRQNDAAKVSPEPFPLLGRTNLTAHDLEPVFRKYWALYHVGTAEYVRLMAYMELRNLARQEGDETQAVVYQEQAKVCARRIGDNYFYAQAYDQNGWLWQPSKSLQDLVDFYY